MGIPFTIHVAIEMILIGALSRDIFYLLMHALYIRSRASHKPLMYSEFTIYERLFRALFHWSASLLVNSSEICTLDVSAELQIGRCRDVVAVGELGHKQALWRFT